MLVMVSDMNVSHVYSRGNSGAGSFIVYLRRFAHVYSRGELCLLGNPEIHPNIPFSIVWSTMLVKKTFLLWCPS